MMLRKILLTTAYLPPLEYFSAISHADDIFIEYEENYLKQSYRNRCYILSSHGLQCLTVPVYLGSQHKTQVKDIKIDYTKRWQQVHLRAITASYSSSPYFQFYFENIEKIISGNNEFLLDLNMRLTITVLEMLKLRRSLTCTTSFQPVVDAENDYRYKISPKKESHYSAREYMHVFDSGDQFIHRLSIIDLIFNKGPEALEYF
jgi:hypothetical protein